jgi:hypothetical protein
MVGDHEPAPRISGVDDERAVPMHVISGDPALLEPFLDWGFTPGMRPGAAAAEHSMASFRAFFVAAFSGEAAAGDAPGADRRTGNAGTM